MNRTLRFALAGALFGLLAVAAPSGAANLAPITGAQDPSQMNATINTLIQSINTGVSGLINAQTGPVGTASADKTVLQTFTTPPGILATAGQALRIRCWGTTAASADDKQVFLSFGANEVSSPVAATNNGRWVLELFVMRLTATTQAVSGTGVVAITPVTTYGAAGAETLADGIAINCSGESEVVTANETVATGMTVEIVK